MSKDSLYIIGNGFDIYHGIHSHYSDFKIYLFDVDHSLHKLVEKFIPAEENWSDLEQALAEIDVDSIVDKATHYLVSYSAEDWSDAYHHDYQNEVNRIIDGLSTELRTRITEWVAQLHIPSRTDIGTSILNIDKNAKYLTFNYTSTLSTAYWIPRANILFIHGEIENKAQEIVLGHAWNPSEIPSLNDAPDPESLDTRVMEGNEMINDYFGSTFKNTRSIIDANHSYFTNLSSISSIFVLGHSLSKVDINYFKAIIQNIDTHKVRWHISYYTRDELDSHRKTMSELGINSGNMDFLELHEIQYPGTKIHHI